MRSEQEMLSLMLNTAQEDSRIKAVYMNGSRTNPNAPKDIFQDYDIVYVVGETKPYREDKKWIDRFGERLYMQYPEDSLYYPSDKDSCYGWLIQLADGNRLDLHVVTLSYAQEHILEDKLCKVLLDKEGILPTIPESTDKDYWVRKPSEDEFLCTCNEFWWCLNNVAKGLWREEIPYVQDMLSYYVRPELIKVLSWKIGIEQNFSVSIGKSGKYMYRFLTKETWNTFLETYAGGNLQELWEKVYIMCSLFQETALEVSAVLSFTYNKKEAEASLNFLRHVEQLPKDESNVFPH